MANKWDKLKDESDSEHYQRIDRQVNLTDVMRRDRISPNDPNFKDKVSPYMAGKIDPSLAVHHEFDLPDDAKLNLKGYANASEPYRQEGNIDGVDISHDVKLNTVGTLHNNNTPYVYGHEYRHHNYPDLKEKHNRIVDLIAAQTPMDVDESLRMQADSLGKLPSENFDRARSDLRASWENDYFYQDIEDLIINESEATNEGEVKDLINKSKTKQFLDDAQDLEYYQMGLKTRNKARKNKEPETIADSLRAAYAALGMEKFK